MSQCNHLTSDHKRCERKISNKLKHDSSRCWQHQKHTSKIESDLDPITQQFVNKLVSSHDPPIYTLSPTVARQTLSNLQAATKINLKPVNIKESILPVGPMGKVHVHIVRPLLTENIKLPIVMYFHGGGWVMGGYDTHERLIREIVFGAQVALVFVDYTPSPEAQYPVPIQEAYAATQYIVKNADKFSLDGTKLAVMGDSVGGNMATVVALMATEKKEFAIQLQILLYPVTNAKFDTESYTKFANGPWLTKLSMQWFWDNYLPDINKRNDYHASPLLAPKSKLKGMPYSLIITDENDVLRDEGEAYANRLSQAGVYVERMRYLGTMHDFALLNAISSSPATRAVITKASDILNRKLNF